MPATPAILLVLLVAAPDGGPMEPKPPPSMTLPEFKKNLDGADAPELDAQGLADLEKRGAVVVLDLRSKPSFDALHLRGAVNLPLTEVTEKTLPTLAPSKDTPIALMCNYTLAPTRMVPMTMMAFPVLKAAGYTRIYRLNFWSGAKRFPSQAELEKLLPFEGAEAGKAKLEPENPAGDPGTAGHTAGSPGFRTGSK